MNFLELCKVTFWFVALQKAQLFGNVSIVMHFSGFWRLFYFVLNILVFDVQFFLPLSIFLLIFFVIWHLRLSTLGTLVFQTQKQRRNDRDKFLFKCDYSTSSDIKRQHFNRLCHFAHIINTLLAWLCINRLAFQLPWFHRYSKKNKMKLANPKNKHVYISP